MEHGAAVGSLKLEARGWGRAGQPRKLRWTRNLNRQSGWPGINSSSTSSIPRSDIVLRTLRIRWADHRLTASAYSARV
jgi:hypothetical protein